MDDEKRKNGRKKHGFDSSRTLFDDGIQSRKPPADAEIETGKKDDALYGRDPLRMKRRKGKISGTEQIPTKSQRLRAGRSFKI